MQNTARKRPQLTIRNNPSQEALPMRRLGFSFLPGGRAGRRLGRDMERTHMALDRHGIKVRRLYEERTAKKKNISPPTMDDPGLGRHLRRVEPYYDKFGTWRGVSGTAGELRGQIQTGGNPR